MIDYSLISNESNPTLYVYIICIFVIQANNIVLLFIELVNSRDTYGVIRY